MSPKKINVGLYSIVVDNGSGMMKYSVIKDGAPIPKGWKTTGKKGTKQVRPDYIEEVWTDMRPPPSDLSSIRGRNSDPPGPGFYPLRQQPGAGYVHSPFSIIHSFPPFVSITPEIVTKNCKQHRKALELMIYLKGPAFHKCLINLPENHSLEESCTLVVGLHGGGANPDSLITLWDRIPNRSFIYAVPQAPYPFAVNTELMFDWAMWPSENEELIGKATEISEKYIVSVVQEMSVRYNIDEVYLAGFSQGAIFAYLVGIKQHLLFNGIICLSGPGLLAPLKNPFLRSDHDWLTEKHIQDAKNLRVFITHGKEDQAANPELGIRSRDVLINYGHDVTFRDFEGGHRLPPKEILIEIADWITESNQKN